MTESGWIDRNVHEPSTEIVDKDYPSILVWDDAMHKPVVVRYHRGTGCWLKDHEYRPPFQYWKSVTNPHVEVRNAEIRQQEIKTRTAMIEHAVAFGMYGLKDVQMSYMPKAASILGLSLQELEEECDRGEVRVMGSYLFKRVRLYDKEESQLLKNMRYKALLHAFWFAHRQGNGIEDWYRNAALLLGVSTDELGKEMETLNVEEAEAMYCGRPVPWYELRL